MISVKYTIGLIVIFTITGFSSLNAQEIPQAQKNLQRFAGNWQCKDLSLMLEGKTYKGEFYFNAKSVLDGLGIYAEEGFDNEELGKMRGFNLMSYDPNQQIIHWYTIDNLGTCHDHLGYWSDPDHFYAEFQGLVEGKIYVEKIYFTFLNDNKIDFKLAGETNGMTTESITGIFTK